MMDVISVQISTEQLLKECHFFPFPFLDIPNFSLIIFKSHEKIHKKSLTFSAPLMFGNIIYIFNMSLLLSVVCAF